MAKKDKTAVPAVDEARLDWSLNIMRQSITQGVDLETELQKLIPKGGQQHAVSSAALVGWRHLLAMIYLARDWPPDQRELFIEGASSAFQLGAIYSWLGAWSTLEWKKNLARCRKEARKATADEKKRMARQIFHEMSLAPDFRRLNSREISQKVADRMKGLGYKVSPNTIRQRYLSG